MLRHVESLRIKELISARDRKVREKEKEIRKYKDEVLALKMSSAYRVGMFITWPLRKVYRAFNPIGG